MATIISESGALPVTVDGTAYYADGLPRGKLTLRLYTSPDGVEFCDFTVAATNMNSGRDALRYDIDTERLASDSHCKF